MHVGLRAKINHISLYNTYSTRSTQSMHVSSLCTYACTKTYTSSTQFITQLTVYDTIAAKKSCYNKINTINKTKQINVCSQRAGKWRACKTTTRKISFIFLLFVTVLLHSIIYPIKFTLKLEEKAGNTKQPNTCKQYLTVSLPVHSRFQSISLSSSTQILFKPPLT